MKKIMYRVLALSQFNLNTRSSIILLDSAASVYVFNRKKRFSNFKKALKGQDLLCGSNVISIKGGGQISLPLKVKSQIKLLTLNNVAYISNFSLNLVSFGYLQKRDFDWSHRSGKLLKNDQIIGYTRFHGNNYKIGHDKIGEMGFATLAMNPATLKNSRQYKKSHFAATLDIWHHKMGHIDPLGLHMLGKKYLGVQLQGKKMSQYRYCAMSKIFQQVSYWPPANQLTQAFYRVYIDGLNLEDGWNSYQIDEAVLRGVMVAICKATGMAVTYFTQSAKESENLPLIQNFVNWFAKRYNLYVKVIRFNNKMKQIKTTNWCNQNGIFFEPCALDTHAQNGGVEHFGRLIMEKVRAMRLSANLLHKL